MITVLYLGNYDVFEVNNCLHLLDFVVERKEQNAQAVKTNLTQMKFFEIIIPERNWKILIPTAGIRTMVALKR